MRRPARPGVTRRALTLARPVKMLVLDVDGVLTDNGVTHEGPGDGYKRFAVQDGLGVKLCQRAGIEVAILSGLNNAQARHRADELGITEFHGGYLHKLPVFEELLASKGLDASQAAYMGDDWLDAPVLDHAGLSMAPADAQPEILSRVSWVSRFHGGRGAVREAIRFLLMAQGKLQGLFSQWL